MGVPTVFCWLRGLDDVARRFIPDEELGQSRKDHAPKPGTDDRRTGALRSCSPQVVGGAFPVPISVRGKTSDPALQRGDQLGLRYSVAGVPALVINGKYVTDVRSAGSPERLLALVGDLSAQEHKH